MTRTLIRLATVATFSLTACDVNTTSQTFGYDLTRTSDIDVAAITTGGPLRGVVVSVRAPAVAPDQVGELLWMGATGADGHARAHVRTDRAGDGLDVTLHKAGWRGTWTDEALRASQGITAPSARLIVPLIESQKIQVTLERSQ